MTTSASASDYMCDSPGYQPILREKLDSVADSTHWPLWIMHMARELRDLRKVADGITASGHDVLFCSAACRNNDVVHDCWVAALQANVAARAVMEPKA